MSDDGDEARDIVLDRNDSPGSGIRKRMLGRASTFAEAAPRFARRGSSFVSDSVSESRRSFFESTDDLLLPKVSHKQEHDTESTHWHSIPLGLAFLPAVAGLFFENGSAFVTDISLLALAALFLNWAVRLPWDWYLSAQAIVEEAEPEELSAIEDESLIADKDGPASPGAASRTTPNEQVFKAQNELRIHEALALLACFCGPALAAWLLHAIRAQLTARSEGLISDYNLTIFLLASEVRPVRHLIKLVQRRTLFLQRTISASENHGARARERKEIDEVLEKIHDLESKMADSVMIVNDGPEATPSNIDELIMKTSTTASADVRRAVQPELDALNRAMRRYEKSKITFAVQVETRLQELDAKLENVVVLAAATQRNAEKHRGKYTATLTNWISACFVIPIHYFYQILMLPQTTLTYATTWARKKLGFPRTANKTKEQRTPKSSQSRKAGKERQKMV